MQPAIQPPSDQRPQRPRRRTCVHALLLCGLAHSRLAAADLIPGLGLSVDTLPVASVLWDCTADGCFTNGCPGDEQLWDSEEDTFWWNDLDEYEKWTNSCDRDYDYSVTDPDQLYASACTWLSACQDKADSACNDKCVLNVFQDLNDAGAAVPGQQDALQRLVKRNRDMIDANGCAFLGTLIGTCDSGPSSLGLSPADMSALNAAEITVVAERPCPSESDVDCAADLLNQIRDEYANVGPPYNTAADKDIWPFSYVPGSDTADVASTFSFIGGAEEAKAYLKEHCTTGVLSANYLTYFEFSGLRIGTDLESVDYSLNDPSSAAIMCRDNARVLENQLKRSIVRQADKDRLAVIRAEVQNGACLNNNELVHLDPDVRSTEGFIASSMFGAGAGTAGGSKHCQQELLNGMREMHEACSQLTSREACMQQRYPALQKSIAALRNTMITGVASDNVSQECLRGEEEASEYVTCKAVGAPAGEAQTLAQRPLPILTPVDQDAVDAAVADAEAADEAAAAAAATPVASAAAAGAAATVAAAAAAVAMLV